ncbi:MAG: hypothetical protein NZ749_12890 [bacterium]|nr:hypothetical protein [bacterium]
MACGAGELVEQQKPLEGGSWATSALYLQGIALVRRNSEWHHFDPLGTAGVITNSSASVISNNLVDVFGVLRYEQGSAQTPWRWETQKRFDESLLTEACPTEVVPAADTVVAWAKGNVAQRQPTPGGTVTCLSPTAAGWRYT